ATHESTVFQNVTQARAAAVAAGASASPQERAQAENMLTTALRSVFAVAENYPQLQAVQEFKDLSENLTATEDKIAFARRFYNGNVRDFNTALQTFPTNVFAGMLGFKPDEYFELAEAGERELRPDEEQQLHNIVETLAIGLGIPTPRLYVIEDSAPNAFATGRDPQHASVVVTRGLLDKLDRTELEGVIAHELSHVGNRDIRVMVLVTVLVGTVALLADWMWR